MRIAKGIRLSTLLCLTLACFAFTALAAEQASSKLNVNTASAADLQALPGISKKQADKIIANRPYNSVSGLSKAGLSAKKIKKLEPLVTFEGGAAASAPAKEEKAAGPSGGASASTSGATEHPHRNASASSSTAETAQTPPHQGMVWASPRSKVYHIEGDRYYGKTKHGEWMTEADALKAGYRKAKTR